MKLARIALIGLLAGPALPLKAAESPWLAIYLGKRSRLEKAFRKSMPHEVVASCLDAAPGFILFARGIRVMCNSGIIQGPRLDDLRQEGFALIEDPNKSQSPMETGAYQLIDSALFHASAGVKADERVSMSKLDWRDLHRALRQIQDEVKAERRRAEAAAEAERIGRALEHSGAGSSPRPEL